MCNCMASTNWFSLTLNISEYVASYSCQTEHALHFGKSIWFAVSKHIPIYLLHKN